MPSRNKSNLSSHPRNALRQRLKRGRETDEKRSERLAAARESQKRRYNKKKVKNQEPPTCQVRIENVRTLRPGADKRCSEKDWLKAVKLRMCSEKAWLVAMKERLNSEMVRLKSQGPLNCGKHVHCKPLLNSLMEPLNCGNPTTSEKDLPNSEMDLSISEQDSYTSMEGGLHFLCLREKTQTVVTVKEEVFDD